MEPGIGTVAASGNITVSPSEETVYTLTATGPGGSATATATVSVTYPPPTVSLAATPSTILKGESAQLTWSSAHALSCTIEPGIGAVATNGSLTVTPAATTTYTIVATGYESVAMASATVTVNDPAAPPTVTFTADPQKIPQGGSAVLSWTSFNGEKAHLDNGIGQVATEGVITVSPEHTALYTLTISGPTGSVNAQIRVKVTGNPLPQPDGAFGQQYEDLIPEDATISEYDPRRFSVITGLVHNIAGEPLSGVIICVHNHPEYGTVLTDETGRFYIPVEGGTVLTIVYNKPSLITAQRKIDVPWNDFVSVAALQMIREDTKTTKIVFDGDPNTVMIHDSTRISDEFGPRSCSMIFRGDNQAYLVDRGGNDIYSLDTIYVRASEYATQASMPAKLPPTSGYTYCTELGVDGLERVRFEKPAMMFVDNFLGFDVGEIVPVGYYDRNKATWIPLKNGKVVRLLDLDADGNVDSLDATGDGMPNDLDMDGQYMDEADGLEDPARYPVGSTFWRAEIDHFSPVDLNWSVTAPVDAIESNEEKEPIVAQHDCKDKDCARKTNSFIEERSRVYHEDIAIPGANITLHYSSHRVPGYATEIMVPASGPEVPSSLKRIEVSLKIAGREFIQVLPPLPDQTADFFWDGKDQLGRQPVYGAIGRVDIGFIYQGSYLIPSGTTERDFAMAGVNLSEVASRIEFPIWKTKTIHIYKSSERKFSDNIIASGWTLSLHHYLNRYNGLEKGDGFMEHGARKWFGFNFLSHINIIDTVAGNGTIGDSGGDDPLDAQFNYPEGLAVDASGNVLIVDRLNQKIRKISPEGLITTVAGNGSYGFSGDGGPAIAAQLADPWEVAVDSSGTVYVSDTGNHRIRKVSPDGVITTVAGNGIEGFSGDGGSAAQAQLNNPMGIEVDRFGNLYISDSGNQRIRKVDPQGIIATIVGDPEESGGGYGGYGGASVFIGEYGGDEGSAYYAKLNNPQGIALDANGILYIADTENLRIRKVDTNGIITSVAGNGESGNTVDGIPATDARFMRPCHVALDGTGIIYISDKWSHVILAVDTNGIIKKFAGWGVSGFRGEGSEASNAMLSTPSGLATGRDMRLYIADSNNQRIRQIRPHFPMLFRSAAQIYTKSNGLGFEFSYPYSRHTRTVELDTGKALYNFGYDQDSRITSIEDRFANRIEIERDGSGVPYRIISPDGIETGLVIDENNHLARIDFPDGNHYAFEYSEDGLLLSKIDPNGSQFNNTFDETGRLVDVSDPEGGVWTYSKAVNAQGETTTDVISAEENQTQYLDSTDETGSFTSTITSPSGAETHFSQSGLSSTKTLPCGTSLSASYALDPAFRFKYMNEFSEFQPSGLERVSLFENEYEDTNSDGTQDILYKKLSINGKISISKNDIFHSTKVQTSPEGRTVTSHYDPVTLLTDTVEVPGIFDMDFAYDYRGRLTSTTADTRQTAFAYNASGFLASVTDPQGRITRYSHDPVGRVTGVERPDGSTVGFSYDKNGNMTGLTVPSGVEHRFFYTGVNLNSEYETPISGSYTYLYDRDRRLTEKIFPSGQRIVNVYDPARLIQIQTPEGNIDFTYLCANTIGSVTQGTESIAYTYDGSLVTSESLFGTLNQTFAYSYNNDFNVASATYAGGTVNFAYDDDGLLVGAGGFTIGRRADNGLPETVSDGTLNLSRGFNGHGEIASENISVSGAGVYAWTAARDNVGRITEKSESMEGVTTDFAYTYDAMGRLLSVTKGGVLIEEYRYNPDGTRSFEMNAARGITGRAFSYSDEEHLLTAGDATYQYDVDGFLTTKTQGTETTTYDHSSRGELLSASLPDGRYVEYVHDPLGRRIAKKIDGVIVEKYLWQGLTRLLAVYDDADNLLMRFEYADGRMPLAMVRAGIRYYLTFDQVGSLRIVADTTGNVVKRIDYDAFGNILSDSNPGFTVPFGFAGGLHDRDTGLVRFGYRDYDPDIGHWTAKDPIFFDGGDTDLYGYVLNNPVNLFDPTGEYGIPGAVLGIVLGASAGFTSGIVSGNPSAGFWSGIAGAVAGGVAGGAVGFFAPNASPLVGGMIGGLVGGATAGSVNVRLSEGPCAEFRQYANAVVFGGFKGAVLGAVGGGIVSSAAAVGATGAAVETTASLITMPVGLAADVTTSKLLGVIHYNSSSEGEGQFLT
ncbi:MAG: hypothetical protein JEZ11_17955 [Desulfobacterales bacterium]|nr:hypothetical protein [Desulfobacterales bacterium]